MESQQVNLLDAQPSSFNKNLDWVRKNAVNPFLNGLLVEPAQAAGQIVNGAARACGGRDVLPKVELLEVDKAEIGSTEFWVQNISSGLSFVIPYAGASRIAGAGLRCTAMALRLESTAAKLGAGKQLMNTALRAEQILVSKQTANIAGSVAYDGLKDLHEGQSRAGNMGRSAVQFGTFETMNAATKFIPQSGAYGAVLKHVVAPALIGATGTIAGAVTESTINGKKIDLNEIANHAVSGGALNLVLPHVQQLPMRFTKAPSGFHINETMLASEYATKNNWAGKSPVLDLMIARNPLARVKAGEYNSADHSTGKISLRKDATPAELAHELHHLQKVRREGGAAGSVESRLQAEKLARQVENRAAKESNSSQPKQSIELKEIAAEKTPKGLTYKEHFRQEMERGSAQTDFAAVRRTGLKVSREGSQNKEVKQAPLQHDFLKMSSLAHLSASEALSASAETRIALGWQETSPFIWERSFKMSSAEVKEALSATPDHWQRDSFFPGTFNSFEGTTKTTLKQNESLTIESSNSRYVLSKNGTEQIVDHKRAQLKQEEILSEEALARKQKHQEIQREADEHFKQVQQKQTELFKATKERRRKDAEDFNEIRRDPLLNAAHRWRDTKFDGTTSGDIIGHRYDLLNKALLNKGLIKTPLDLHENRSVEQWLWEVYLNPNSFDASVKHAMRENPDLSELHHKHILSYLKVPGLKSLYCAGADIRAGGESLVFPLANRKEVFKIMRPKFKPQYKDFESYGKRPFDAELLSPIEIHTIDSTEKIISYKQEKLEPLTEAEYQANPSKWKDLVKQIKDAGYRCPDMEGKWWQVGKNSQGEWKLLDYGAAISKRVYDELDSDLFSMT